MDLVTHLPVTAQGHNSIVTFVDRLSKYVYFVPCRADITAEQLANIFLATVVARHGMPQRLVSDRDTRFTSRFWKSLMGALGAMSNLSTAYHPQTDGQSERFHRSVEQVLRCMVTARQDNWDVVLPLAEFALNSTRSSATGHTPAMVVFGREPTLPLEHAVRNVTDCPVEAVSARVKRMQETVQLVRTALDRTSDVMARGANKHRREGQIVVNGFAWLSTEHLVLAPGLSRKLADRFVGPFKVVGQVGAVSFKLELPRSWRIHNVFHVSQLKHAEGCTAGGDISNSQFRPAADSDGEFEVEDLLDHRSRGRGRNTQLEYLVKWKGYSTFESTWEPVSNLTHCSRVLAAYRQRRGLR